MGDQYDTESTSHKLPHLIVTTARREQVQKCEHNVGEDDDFKGLCTGLRISVESVRIRQNDLIVTGYL